MPWLMVQVLATTPPHDFWSNHETTLTDKVYDKSITARPALELLVWVLRSFKTFVLSTRFLFFKNTIFVLTTIYERRLKNRL